MASSASVQSNKKPDFEEYQQVFAEAQKHSATQQILSEPTNEVIVVADSTGFVGAFYSELDAANMTVKRYPGQAFIMYRFSLNPECQKNTVFIIPYKNSDAVAFVSNDRTLCMKIYNTLVSVGLTYENSATELTTHEIDFWEHPVGILCAPVKAKLDTLSRGIAFTDNQSEEKLFSNSSGPLSQALENITIMDAVVLLA